MAKTANQGNDIAFPFLEFLWQRASWPNVIQVVQQVRCDVRYLATCLAKIDHFFAARSSLGPGASSFVATELEYLFVLSRSVLDLVHQAVALVWKRIKFHDPSVQKRKRDLPESIAKVCLKEDRRVVPVDEIQSKYQLPSTLAEAYSATAEFLARIRRFRDDVVHRGAGVDIIFTTDRGFCVDPSTPPFGAFEIWKKGFFFNDRIASLRPFTASVVASTLDACESMIDGLASQVEFPPALAPDYSVFMRAMHNDALIDAVRVLEGQSSPWWETENRSQ